jgi:hypothetical protein
MKKIFTLSLLAMVSFFSNAQDVMGIVGQFTGWGANPDIVMTSSDGVQWDATAVVITEDGGVKFRLNSDWGTNWGTTDQPGFPSGTAQPNNATTPDPSNILAIAGTYDVSFNTATLAYSFTPVQTSYDEIGFTGGFNGYSATVPFATQDGVQYFKSDFFFSHPGAAIKNETTNQLLGATGFPIGVAAVGGPEIPVTVGYYNLGYDKSTNAYGFQQVSVGIIGDAVPTTGWSEDVDMISTDGGITHYLYNFTINDGLIKFRANNSWGTNWGGSAVFPQDTAYLGGSDIAAVEGTYDTISFNRFTGEFCFGCSVASGLGIKELAQLNATAYPVPAQDLVTFVADFAEFNVTIQDLTGKTVMVSQAATVDLSALNAGTYIYVLRSGTKVATGKLIKQ